MTPRAVDPETRKAQILTAALSVFAQKGFHRASMNDIVAAAGLSKGGVYWHFESKESIIMAILAAMFERDTQAMLALAGGDGTAASKIRAILAHSTAELTTQADLLPIIYEFYALATRQPEVRAFLRGYFEQYAAVLTQLVAEGVAAGELATAEPATLAHALMAQFEGHLILATLTQQTADFAPNTQAAIDWLLEAAIRKP
ncbi:MAG: TetR/AcrR family transcriptional regulator [Chloroflexi bacterium]|nr:TetR/AcrR family transcriptional regulator [Chloroflexota bacterium]